MLKIGKLRSWVFVSISLILGLHWTFPTSALSKEETAEELKAKLSDTAIRDRPKLCVQISELQLADADKLYRAGNSEKAHAAMVDVVAFSELARDYSIQSHHREKESEIAIRKMVHKLTDLKQAVTFVDQKPIEEAIDRLQKVRDDLLMAMFPKVEKK
jgi:hypothetical protein